jgi:ferrochelatase
MKRPNPLITNTIQSDDTEPAMLKELKSDARYLERPGDQIDFGEEKWGVFFLNLGGPETAEEVPEYLYKVYSDRLVIRFPLSHLLQRPLAKMLAARRAPKVAQRYQMIGGGSPLLKWTRLVAAGVKRELSKQYPQAEVFAGMRYAEPYITDELDAAVGEGCRHLVLLPMYPQYCQATTGTALAKVIEWLEDVEPDLSVSVIEHWHQRPRFIELVRRQIEAAMEQVADRSQAKVVFSAHAIPQKLAASGDPYLLQIKETAALAGDGYDYAVTFHSRPAPMTWVGPDTLTTIRQLARKGVREMVVVPISTVSDHLETLYGIDIQIRDAARRAGVKTFVRVESFNDDVHFTTFLADLVEEKIAAR